MTSIMLVITCSECPGEHSDELKTLIHLGNNSAILQPFFFFLGNDRYRLATVRC